MSFALTTEQVRNQTKTVTRRQGWENLKPGDIVNACVKCMGLKKGEKVEKICQIRVIDVSREPILWITSGDVVKEGFPEWEGDCMKFVQMYCTANKVGAMEYCTRIEFEYINNN